MNYYGMTDIGRKREINEDNFEVYEIAENACLLVVCDGMGGHDGGEIASGLALSSFISEIENQIDGKLNGGKLCLGLGIGKGAFLPFQIKLLVLFHTCSFRK